jgi:signal transduction histidine kinase
MRTLIAVLTAGFLAVILLLAGGAVVGVRNARSVAASATGLAADQLVITRLLDEVEREQEALNAAYYRLARRPETVDRDAVLRALDETDRQIEQLANTARGGPDETAWRDLDRAVHDFSHEARKLLDAGRVPQESQRDLFFRHEQVTAMVAHLVDLSYARAATTQGQVEAGAAKLARETGWIVGASIAIALITAGITVRIAVRVFRQMRAQAEELSRVSFRLLEAQEDAARRFSHELHDELGGSLTAIKTNLNALPSERRRDDSLKLVDDAISNVRELSQLLRPTILDDFGLDAGIRWLIERFQERTGIAVDFVSTFEERVADQTETHLFRIVQEALTNVARHSGAKHVTIRLEATGSTIRLTIADDGRGLQPARRRGMGLNGISARARTMGGELKTSSKPGQGFTLEVWTPLTRPVEVSA